MPQIPTKETELIAQAGDTLRGLNDHTTEFPDPPAGSVVLGPLMNAYTTKTNEINEAEQEYRDAIAQKNVLLGQIRDCLVKDLRYAERIAKADNDPNLLYLVNWAPRKQPEPVPPPGTPSSLKVTSWNGASVSLEWGRTSATGCGVPKFYTVFRRQSTPEGMTNWKKVGSATKREATLTNQPTGVQLEYRVTATNTSGTSDPSTTVEIVL